MARKKTEEAFTAQTTPDVNQPPQQAEIVVGIPLQIVMNVIGIIDMAASRGTVKGEELFAVGFTRQRLDDAVRPYLTPQ